jgi:Contractile injection system tube protein
MSMLPDTPTVEYATFSVLEGSGAGGDPVPVQFNPASLEYSIANEFDASGGNNGSRQQVKKTTGKLTMTLIYDTTDTGGDVREQTEHISKLLEPAKDGSKKYAPKIEFGWGTYSFKGVVEQYKETIDFFAASGVPLRASINLTLSSQDVSFTSSKNPPANVDGDLTPDAVSAPAGAGPSDVANAMGDPRAARAIASANGADSLRFGGSASLSVGGGITLSAAASFSVGASASIGGGIGVGGGVGIGGGIGVGGGIGISGGVGVSAGASVGISAGITATAGAAFTGLRVSAQPTVSINIDSARTALLPIAATTGATAFGPGGRARVQTGGSLSADVGSGADLHARIGFDS